MSAPTALITDFDGTAATADIGDAIVHRFVPDGRARLAALDARVAAGELDLIELQAAIWPEVRCGPGELDALLEAVARPRRGFVDLAREALDAGRRVVVASGGFDFYIRRILARWGLPEAPVEVIANEGRARAGGVSIAFSRRERYGCPRCAVCKGRVIEALRAEGHRVVFCGDGVSDRCALGRADALFCVAGSRLHRQAAAAGVPHVSFDDFAEVRPALELA